MYELIFMFSGIGVGFIIGFLFAKNKSGQIYEEKIVQKNNELTAEKILSQKLQSEINILKKAQDELSEKFENIANKSLLSNNEQFIKLAEGLISRMNDESSKDFRIRHNSINDLLKPVKEGIEKHEKTMQEMSLRADKSIAGLENFVQELNKNQKNLQKETGALINALKSPKVRGSWGEIGLKRIAEFSGMSEYCDFTLQVNVNTDNGRLRPDMIVKLPGGKQVVIDSKLPLNSYLNMLETDDDTEKNEFLEKHTKAVFEHVRLLSSKSYWQQFDESVDFVVLYIEVESAFGAALSVNKELVSYAIENRVVFATPTTLIALLQTVAYSWKQHTATENAIKIWQTSKELYERTAIFAEHLEKIGMNIESLTKTFNQVIGSWETRFVPSLKKMEELGVSSEKKKIKNPDKIF